MTIRITGGEARGRAITSPAHKGVRPTASKMRQALFNILAAQVVEARFLDVFAGTGLVGLEALSRGAASLTAVEQNRALALSIRSVAENLGYEADVIVADFRKALPGLAGQKFDIIFADPPYRTNFGQEALNLVSHSNLLDDDAVLVVEHLHQSKLSVGSLSLHQVDRRQYGQSAFSFFKKP